MSKIKYVAIVISTILVLSCNEKNEKFVFAYQDRIVDTLSIVAVEKELINKGIVTKVFSSGSETMEALISGSADVVSMGDSSAIILISKYDNFVIIASQGYGEDRHRIMTSKDIEINSWQDLKKYKIGIKMGTSTHGGLILKSKDNNLDLSQNLIDMQPSLQLTALASGEIDIMVASEPTPSIAESMNVGKYYSSLNINKMQYPVVLVTTKKILENKRLEIESLILSLKKAESYIEKNRVETIKLLSNLNELNEEIIEKSLSLHTIELNSPNDIKESLTILSNILLEMNKIQNIPNWEKSLDNSLFKR